MRFGSNRQRIHGSFELLGLSFKHFEITLFKHGCFNLQRHHQGVLERHFLTAHAGQFVLQGSGPGREKARIKPFVIDESNVSAVPDGLDEMRMIDLFISQLQPEAAMPRKFLSTCLIQSGNSFFVIRQQLYDPLSSLSGIHRTTQPHVIRKMKRQQHGLVKEGFLPLSYYRPLLVWAAGLSARKEAIALSFPNELPSLYSVGHFPEFQPIRGEQIGQTIFARALNASPLRVGKSCPDECKA